MIAGPSWFYSGIPDSKTATLPSTGKNRPKEIKKPEAGVKKRNRFVWGIDWKDDVSPDQCRK